MSTIHGQFWGDTHGKVAGVVFARSKGGKSIRARVKPTDAKTQAQLSTRAGFSGSASLWGSLDATAKRLWNSFAVTGFRSKHQKKGDTPSGFQAFASSNFVLKTASTHSWPTHFTPTSVVGTFDQIVPAVLAPPLVGFSAAIQSSTGDPIFLSLFSFNFDPATGICVAQFGMNPAPVTVAPVFQNPVTDEPVSFNFYCSAPIAPGRQTVNRTDAYFLGNSGFPEITGGWVSASSFELKWTVPASYLSSIKLAFQAGNDVFITAYAVSGSGQISRIGMLRVTL